MKKVSIFFLVFFATFAFAAFHGNHRFYLANTNGTEKLIIKVPGAVVGNSSSLSSQTRRLFYIAYYVRKDLEIDKRLQADIDINILSDLNCTTVLCAGISIPSSQIEFDIYRSDNNPKTTFSPSIFDLTTQTIEFTSLAGYHSASYNRFILHYKNESIYPAGKYKLRMNAKVTPTR